MKAVGGDHEASLGKNLLCGIQSRPLNYTVPIYQIKLHVRQAEHKTLMNKSPMIWIRPPCGNSNIRGNSRNGCDSSIQDDSSNGGNSSIRGIPSNGGDSNIRGNSSNGGNSRIRGNSSNGGNSSIRGETRRKCNQHCK